MLALTLLITATAGAQTVTLGGSCPGAGSIDVSGLTPGGKIVILGGRVGDHLLSGGPCNDVSTNLDADATVYGPFEDSDNDGIISLTPELPFAACRKWFTAVDAGTCTASPLASYVQCHDLVTPGPLVEMVMVAEDPPIPTGGIIPVGE